MDRGRTPHSCSADNFKLEIRFQYIHQLPAFPGVERSRGRERRAPEKGRALQASGLTPALVHASPPLSTSCGPGPLPETASPARPVSCLPSVHLLPTTVPTLKTPHPGAPQPLASSLTACPWSPHMSASHSLSSSSSGNPLLQGPPWSHPDTLDRQLGTDRLTAPQSWHMQRPPARPGLS